MPFNHRKASDAAATFRPSNAAAVLGRGTQAPTPDPAAQSLTIRPLYCPGMVMQ